MKNITDYFQALELLEAGVPRESADYVFVNALDGEYHQYPKGIVPDITAVPCWSIGALWEYLYEHSCDMAFTFDTEQTTEEVMDGLVKAAKMVKEREEHD